MDVDEARTVRRRACREKLRYGLSTAREVAAAVRRRTGDRVKQYRCPWCRRWHVGHVPSVKSLRRVAQAIRVLAQDSRSRTG